MTLGDYMIPAMQEKGIKQAELARQIGVKRSTINGYVSGRRTKIALPILNAIFKALDLDAFEVMTNCPDLDIDDDALTFDEVRQYLVSTNSQAGVSKQNDRYQREQSLLIAFDALNAIGQTEAVKRVEELTEIPRYTAQEED